MTVDQHRIKLRAAGALALNFCLPAASHAQASTDYPAKPISLIVPWPVGGATDIIARILAERLQPHLGQPVIVDNRAGATGYIGSRLALQAPKDGYTLLMMAASVHSFSPAVMKSMPFDPIKDFQPISQVVTFPYVMVVPVDSAYRSVADVVAAAKKKPEGVSYGSIGNGSASHMISEMIGLDSNTKLLHVPYKGGSQALVDLMGGQVDFLIDSLPSPLPQIKAGKVRALAMTSAQRFTALPDVPALSETLKGFEAISWLGVGVAPGVPSPIATRIGEAIRKVCAEPAYAEKLRTIGAEPAVSSSPQEFVQFLEREKARWTRVAVDAHIPKLDNY